MKHSTRRCFAVPVTLLLLAGPASAQNEPTQYSTVFGGSGGNTFSLDCGPGRVLAGLRGREGLFVDAIGLICRTVNANGALGSPSAVGNLRGGGGGRAAEIVCPSQRPVAVGLYLSHGTYVDNIRLVCGAWDPATRTWGNLQLHEGFLLGGSSRDWNAAFHCSSRKQPMAGVRGRAQSVVDAIGAKCDEP